MPDFGGSSSSSSAPTSQTVTQTTIPEYARPYVEQMLGGAAGLTYDYQRDASGNVQYDASGMPKVAGIKPYQAYTGERQAQFSPLQQQSYAGAQNLGQAPSLAGAIGTSQQASQRALDTSYTPTQAQNQFVDRGQYQMQGPADVQAASFNAPPDVVAERIAAERVQAMKLRDLSMQAASAQYDPSQLQQYQMGPAERVSTEAFNRPETAQSYMSPYMQNVVNAQQREAQRAADIQKTYRGADVAKQGAFGGSRHAIMEAEAARNLATQMGDIQATGLQRAYDQAQGAFMTDQARALQAAQANQQAGLTTGGQNLAAQLGVQQLGAGIGAQYGLANLANQQQANLQNLSAGLQTQGLAAQTGLTAQQLNQQAALEAARANQQTGLQASLANQQVAYNTALQNAQLAQQAALANQQAGMTTGQANLNAALQAGGLQAQYGQAANQLAEQSRQYGAGLGMQGIQTALQGAGQTGALGQLGFGQQTGAIGLQNQLGTQQQGQMQNILNQQYQDFQNQQRYPYQQMAFMSDMLRGLPMSQTASTMYQAQPSMVSQLGGLAGAGYMASRMASGGAVNSTRSAGLADLAISKIM